MTTPETPSLAPAPSLEQLARETRDAMIHQGSIITDCAMEPLRAALRQATQHPAVAAEVPGLAAVRCAAPDAAGRAETAHPVNYDGPTPETDALMTQIDDSEIDLGQVQSKLSDFENERNAARARIAELELALLAVGDMAVADWNDAAVGAVDAVVKEPARYRDMLKSLFSAAKERDTLRASLAAVEKERDEAKEQHERDCLELIDERDKAQEAISHAFYLVLGHSPEWSNIFGLDQATEEIDLAQRALRAALTAAQERVKALEADGARLDWLGAHPFTAYRGRDYEDGRLDEHFTLVDEDKHPNGEGRTGIVRNTFRECLDAARAQPSEEGRPCA